MLITSMPTTPLGRTLVELLGHAGPLLLVVPLHIVAAEYGRVMQINVNTARRRRRALLAM